MPCTASPRRESRSLNPPRAIEAAVDKYLTLALLGRAGLPVPATWTGQSAVAALSAFDELGGDVVVKPLFGSEGRGLVRVSDRELAWRTFHALERIGAVLYLQQVVRHPGFDLRVFVLDGAVLGAMRRYAPPGDWRTNVSLGGRAEPCRLSAEEERLAIAAAARRGGRRGRRRPDPRRATAAGRSSWRSTPSPAGGHSRESPGVDVAAAVLDALLKARSGSSLIIEFSIFEY